MTNREGGGERVDGTIESSKRPLAIAHCNKAKSLIFIASYLFGWVDPIPGKFGSIAEWAIKQ